MRAIRLRLSQPRARSTAPPCGRCTRSALADRAGAYRRGGSFSSGRRLILRLLALPEGRDEPRQPFCKFIAAGQSQPTLLHVEIALDRGWTQGGFRQQPAFLRTLKALTDFFAEVLEHGAPPKVTGGGPNALSAIVARGLVFCGRWCRQVDTTCG